MPTRIFAASLLFLLAACGANPPAPPKAGEALIVFVRPSLISQFDAYQPSYGPSRSYSIHDVSGPQRRLVGILTDGKKVGYRVAAPGRHLFASAALTAHADVLEAFVAPGRTYYVIVESDGKFGHTLRPVRRAEAQGAPLARWLHATTFVERTRQWDAWEQRNAQSLDARAARARLDWEARGGIERAARTLTPEDGSD